MSFLLVLLAVALCAFEREHPQLRGRVVVGYQGWFSAPGDGTGLGWRHWGRAGRFESGYASVDLWPDVSELPASKRYATAFRHTDGRVARVFSSADPELVSMHFRWMREHGIGGAFLQRFVASTKTARLRAFRDRVLENVEAASRRHELPWALMYDLSGCANEDLARSLPADLRRLRAKRRFGADPRYLHVGDKPLLGIWGIGFSDGRKYDMRACRRLVEELHNEGWALFLGVPFWWRTQERDAVASEEWGAILARASVVSPWSVGRYASVKRARSLVAEQLRRDRAEPTLRPGSAAQLCPVVFPGFSWHKLTSTRAKPGRLDQIPRRSGAFLRAQLDAALEAGARSIYVAMFDEVDEGTAIMKVSSDPPVGASPFLQFGDDDPELYLRIVGDAARRLRD